MFLAMMMFSCVYAQSIPGNTCTISDSALLSAGTSGVKCDVTDVQFCSDCVCSLTTTLFTAFQSEASQIGTNWCNAGTNSQLADCQAEYVYLLFQNNVITDTIAQALGNCTTFDYTQCADYAQWTNWYTANCGVVPSPTPVPTPVPSPIPVDSPVPVSSPSNIPPSVPVPAVSSPAPSTVPPTTVSPASPPPAHSGANMGQIGFGMVAGACLLVYMAM